MDMMLVSPPTWAVGLAATVPWIRRSRRDTTRRSPQRLCEPWNVHRPRQLGRQASSSRRVRPDRRSVAVRAARSPAHPRSGTSGKGTPTIDTTGDETPAVASIAPEVCPACARACERSLFDHGTTDARVIWGCDHCATGGTFPVTPEFGFVRCQPDSCTLS